MQRRGRGAGGGGDDDMPPPPPLDSDADEPPPPPPPPDSDDDDAPPPPPADWEDSDDGMPPPPPADKEDSDDGMPPPPPDDSDDEAFIPPPPEYDYGDDFGAEPPPPAWDEHDAACAEEAYAEMPEDGQLAELQLTADSKAGFGLSMDNYMAVSNVTGPAARAGWQRGWVVLAVQGRPVSDQQQLVQELTRAGKSARFTVQIPRSDDLFNHYARPGTAAAAGAGAVDPTAADDFYRQDADRSGELDRAEVLQLLQERGIDMQPSYVDGFWDSVDRSGNGTLDMGEYLALLQMLESPSGTAQLRADQQRAVQQEQEQERQEQEGAAVVLQTRILQTVFHRSALQMITNSNLRTRWMRSLLLLSPLLALGARPFVFLRIDGGIRGAIGTAAGVCISRWYGTCLVVISISTSMSSVKQRTPSIREAGEGPTTLSFA